MVIRSGKIMRRIALICACLFLIIPTTVRSAPIEVLSQNYSISGSWTGWLISYYEGYPDAIRVDQRISGGYSDASQDGSPIYGNSYLMPSSFRDGGAEGRVDYLNFYNGARQNFGPYYEGNSEYWCDEALASAHAEWIFRPLTSLANIRLDVGWYSEYFPPFGAFDFELFDRSAGINLISNDYKTTYGYGYYYGATETYTIPLDLSHEYRLRIDGSVDCYGDDTQMQSLQITMTAVPEPTTILLLALGLMGLAGVKRRFNS